MEIRIIAVGKLQKMYLEAENEFLKRLTRYAKCTLIEVADSQAPEKLSPAQKAAVQKEEWERIEKKLSANDFFIALDSSGKQLSSENFAAKLKEWQGVKNPVFALGGSLGFCEEALKRADMRLSLSEMTFTHSMARVILLEQIYRGFKIMNGEPYHK